VRFHEEVRVKNIKAKGKNLPLAALDAEDDDDDDEDDEYEDFGGFGELDEDGEEDEESDANGGQDESSGDEDPLNDSFNGAETIERLKSDLFAEEEDEPPEGVLLNPHPRTSK
jgi:U3 small nucleolar RNA-associated protein MPP10